MLNLMSIALEAHSDDLNRHRRYVVEVGRDLLGDWTVTIQYGRVGEPLRLLRFGSADELSMRRVVHQHLQRRLSAPRRIGCGYRVVGMEAAHGIALGDWVSPKTLLSLVGG